MTKKTHIRIDGKRKTIQPKLPPEPYDEDDGTKMIGGAMIIAALTIIGILLWIWHKHG